MVLYEYVTTTQHILTMKENFDGFGNTLGRFNLVYTRMDSNKMLDNMVHEHDPKAICLIDGKVEFVLFICDLHIEFHMEADSTIK